MSGIFIGIDKPVGMTSHDVVNCVRRVTGIRKVGHAGTLDPNASGVLVVAIGREATRDISTIVAKTKIYEAQILLDRISDTDDTTGLVKSLEFTTSPTIDEIQSTLSQFVGQIDQVPPAYSAVKIKGKEAYKRSRKGEEVKLKARKVRIDEIQLLSYSWPNLQLKITTGPGVYIRSIARDIGTKLNTGGCLDQLRRTKVGEWKITDCLKLEALEDWWLTNTSEV